MALVSVGFLIASFVIVVTPGTGVLYTVSAGISRGRRASVVAAFGCTLGILPHVLAAITGLAALLNASAVAFQSVKYLGVAYLLYLAWGTLRGGDELVVETDAAPRSAARVIVRGILLNILNPKLTIFFFAFLPQFVNTAAPGATVHMTVLSAVFMAMTFVVFVAYGHFAALFRDQVIARPSVARWIRRSFATAYSALAATLALTDV
jgi:threonine/homoserine/homoserine lactone efflux protein